MTKIEPGSAEDRKLRAEALNALQHQQFVADAKARADRRVAEVCRQYSDAHGFCVPLRPEQLRREVSAA